MQFSKLVSAIALGACLAVLREAGGAGPHEEQLPLSSLDEGCSLQKRWIGIWPRQQYGVMLRCNGVDFFMTHVNNLLGHVHVRTAEQALEYARLMSSAETYTLFSFDGMLEVVPQASGHESPSVNSVPSKVFRQWKLTSPRVLDRGSNPCKPTLDLVCGKEFEVTRTVVLWDQRVYEVVESVRERGFYYIVAKKVLLKDATRIGISHYGDL
jgi:hypothetical protein